MVKRALVIAGSPRRVLEQLVALREETGHFGTLLMAGHDWDQPSALAPLDGAAGDRGDAASSRGTPTRARGGADMKVATWRGGGRFTLDTAPDPVAGPGQVVVDVTRRGYLRHRRARDPGPLPVDAAAWCMGHEYSGVVREVGRGVSRRLVGRTVACEPSYGCGKCAGVRRTAAISQCAQCDAGRRLRRARRAARALRAPAAEGARCRSPPRWPSPTVLLPLRARDVPDAARRDRGGHGRRHHGARHHGAGGPPRCRSA